MRKYIALLLIGFAGFAIAGTTCFTTTTQEDITITTVCGAEINGGVPCTGPQVKAWVIQWVVNQVNDYERRQNQSQYSPTATVNPQ